MTAGKARPEGDGRLERGPLGSGAGGAARVQDGIALAARWRLLGLLLERPRPGWHAEVALLAAETPDRILRAAADAASTASEGFYLALLGPGAPVSPREVGCARLRDPGWVLADLARYYDAFGYAPRAEDPVDHVAVEVGFVGFLHLKESLAWAEGDAESALTVAAARAAFTAEHLAAFASGMTPVLELAPASHVSLALDVLTAWLGDAGAGRRALDGERT